MRKKTMIASAIAGGTVITALIAGPSMAAAAQNGQGSQNGQHQQTGQAQSTNGHGRGSSDPAGIHTGGKAMGHGKAGGQGQGQEPGSGQGSGHGSGSGLNSGSTAIGTMTEEQKAELAFMAEEELVAHDLYTAFASLYDTPVFSRVANSESKHLEAVRKLMERYGVTDPRARPARKAHSLRGEPSRRPTSRA